MWNLVIVLIAVIFYCFTSPFYQMVNPVSYSVSLPDKLDGPLSPNDALDKAERLHENALHWPESFATHKGQLYTGLGDGRIVRVSDKEITEISRTGEPCQGQHEEHICGRPLGMTFNKAGQLFVVDAYLGLFSVDVKSGKKTHLLPSNKIVEDLPLTFLNSITFDDKEEALYMTQSSSRWNLSMVVVGLIEHDTSGRLLKYDLKTKKVSAILTDLSFPNGIELSHDGTALLVVEGHKHKIFKYYIKGNKAGLNQEIPMKLPGMPDNIKKSRNGRYWITSTDTYRSHENPTILDRFSDKPFWRKLVIHLQRLSTMPIATILQLLPYKEAKEIGFELQSARLLADYIISNGLILEFDDAGNIIQSLQSPTGKGSHFSEVFEHNGYLYLGSWRNRYIGRLKL